MPTNNFKLFDEKKANMMTDEEYAINQQRLNGVQSGVASSQLQNKTLYQTALMCYALAQLIAANGYDANDANAVSTFVNNLSLSVLQKVVDKASATDVANKVAGKWIDAKQLGELKTDVADNYLPLLGGTMLGDLILHGDPVSSLQAATKQYVDKRKFIVGTYTGNATERTTLQTINVGFKPDVVFVMTNERGRVGSSGYQFLFSVAGDLVLLSYAFTNFELLKIVDSGFQVGGMEQDSSYYGNNASLNTGGIVYHYFAIKISD